MDTEEPHSLTIRDRGAQHIHRWAPECCCGWVGVFRRRRRDAAKVYDDHVKQKARHAKTNRRGGMAPRPVTPVDQRPAVLR